MDRDQNLDNLHGLELRVLDGPQGGARAPVEAGNPWVLAAGAGSGDIVLQEDRLPPARVRVTADVAQALIEVLEGEVRLGNQVLSAGAQAVWPRAVPLAIGSSTVAWGLACVDAWAEAVAAAEARERAADAPPAIAAAAAERKPLRRRAEVWLAATGAAVLLACVGTLLMARVVAAPNKPAQGPVTLATAIKGSEFASLDSTILPDGRATLAGRLPTLAQRARLDAWLLERGFTPLVDVKVDEALARDVAETLRVQGVPAQVRVAGPGRVEAEVAERDLVKLARAEDVVKRDVRGLDALVLRNTATPLPPPTPPVPDDPGKRIASLVQGDPSYVVTADGARYFVGATLPSGHRITEVAPQAVTLELSGRQSTLNF